MISLFSCAFDHSLNFCVLGICRVDAFAFVQGMLPPYPIRGQYFYHHGRRDHGDDFCVSVKGMDLAKNIR